MRPLCARWQPPTHLKTLRDVKAWRPLSGLKKNLRNDRTAGAVVARQNDRRTTHEIHDNRTRYSVRTHKHVRARANNQWKFDNRNERYHNRLVDEHHGGHVWHDRLYYHPKQGKERVRKHSSSQPISKRINPNPHGAGFWAPQVKEKAPRKCGVYSSQKS